MSIINKIKEFYYNVLANKASPNIVIVSYAGLLFVLCITFRLHISGDTVALISGLNHALICLKCTALKIPCGAEVVHFPIFQYLEGVPFKLLGMPDDKLLNIFGYINAIWFIVAAYVFWKVGRLTGGDAGGHLSILILLSSYLLWYITSTFNEMAVFTLFALLAFSVIDGWKIGYISLIAFFCTLTKEIAFPFVLYFVLLSYAAYEYKDKQCLNIILFIHNFLKRYFFPIIAVFVGVALNAMFNYFRFGTVENISLLWPKLFTPWPYVPNFLTALFISPSGGLVFLWLSLCVFLLAAIICSLHQKTIGKWILLLSVLGIFIVNFGLARWYSPFGWCAWGPRLTLPFLGSVAVIGIYIGIPYILNRYRNIEINKYFLVLIFLIMTISSLPNLAVLLNEGAFFSKMFGIPTKIAIASGVKPFTIQTATAEQYMRASIELYRRNIICPVTIDVVFQYIPVILIWIFAMFYISKAVVSDLINCESPDAVNAANGNRNRNKGRRKN